MMSARMLRLTAHLAFLYHLSLATDWILTISGSLSLRGACEFVQHQFSAILWCEHPHVSHIIEYWLKASGLYIHLIVRRPWGSGYTVPSHDRWVRRPTLIKAPNLPHLPAGSLAYRVNTEGAHWCDVPDGWSVLPVFVQRQSENYTTNRCEWYYF